MTYHLWTYDQEKRHLSIYMNGDGPRTWKHHAGPRSWADRKMEHGTFRAFQCECVTLCEPTKYVAKYKRV